MLHLDLGMQNVSSPELMARQLRNQARKIPALLGMEFINLLASHLGPYSNLYTVVTMAPATANAFQPDADETLAVIVLNAFMGDLFPEDSAGNLAAVMDSYKLILENIPPGQKKPVIVIGALLQPSSQFHFSALNKIPSFFHFTFQMKPMP